MDTKIFETQIEKTGFVLENEVAHLLRRSNWTVISNKFYVDDLEDSVREIDLIAYKVRKVDHLELYTVLVISCKKSSNNVWGLLSREANLNDLNTDWWPLHAWSNDKAIDFQLKEPKAAKNFHEKAVAAGVKDVLAQPLVEVFAFQEMDKKSGAPQNDKPIFSAITSLMKAQAYELGALPLRKKAPSIYQFNLVSVVDTELVRLMFRGSKVSASVIDSEHYIARYIVKKKETFSRIRFLNAKAFETSLQDYDRLHETNVSWFSELNLSFYREVVKDSRRLKVFAEEFNRELVFYVNYYAKQRLGTDPKIDHFWFHWDEKSNALSLEVAAEAKVVLFLNTYPQVIEKTKIALASVYKYSGNFSYARDELPF